MTLTATHHALVRVQPIGPRAESCRFDSACDFNDLESNGDARAHQSSATSHTQPDQRACQIGTINFAPCWDGPTLRPTFVAQVLGQVIMSPGTPARETSRLPYRRDRQGAAVALLLDLNV